MKTIGWSSAYRRKDWCKAVNYSAVVAWAIVATISIFTAGLSTTPIIALVGLPTVGLLTAFLFCWIFVSPVLIIAMRSSLSFLSAFAWGAMIGVLSLSALFIPPALLAWLHGEEVSTTLLGFRLYAKKPEGIFELLETLAGAWPFFLFCAVCGLLVRAIIGPGQAAQENGMTL